MPLDESDRPPVATRRWPFAAGGGAGTGMSTTGRRAFYTTPGDETHLDPTAPMTASPNDRGRFAVRCSSCEAVTAVGLLELVALHLPLTALVPLRRFDHWMRCPACRRRTWAGVTLIR
jgi:uncharacterized protein with PIN domain